MEPIASVAGRAGGFEGSAVAGWSVALGWPKLVACRQSNNGRRAVLWRWVHADGPGIQEPQPLEDGRRIDCLPGRSLAGRADDPLAHCLGRRPRSAAFDHDNQTGRTGSGIADSCYGEPAYPFAGGGNSRFSIGEPATFTVTFAFAFPYTSADPTANGGTDSSSCTSCRPTSSSCRPVRRGNCSRGVSRLRGRIVELQQDPQRHLLWPWRRALVDWKPGSRWARRPLGSEFSDRLMTDC